MLLVPARDIPVPTSLSPEAHPVPTARPPAQLEHYPRLPPPPRGRLQSKGITNECLRWSATAPPRYPLKRIKLNCFGFRIFG